MGEGVEEAGTVVGCIKGGGSAEEGGGVGFDGAEVETAGFKFVTWPPAVTGFFIFDAGCMMMLTGKLSVG